MYTLFIDTHNSQILIVLYKDNKVLSIKKSSAHQNHSVSTMPLIVESLKVANIEIKNISEILVVNGPGSFTGIRIGVTIAKTLSYTLNIPIKVLSSLLIKAVSFKHDTVRIIEREKNGVFIGTFDKNNHLIEDYRYFRNNEYHFLEGDLENIDLDFERIISFASTLKNVNPHSVNPLYVKLIEVLK